MNQREKRIALVGDVVASREIRDRVAFHDTLLTTLNELSQRNDDILSPYTLIGDEIQAVYSGADALFADAVSILSAIHPDRMRFSFGLGALVTPINPLQATEMDGPAFHNARDGVDELKEAGHLFNVLGEDIGRHSLVQHTLFLISHNMDSWNRNRLRTLAMLQQDLPVKEIAKELHISDKAVYKTMNVGALELIMSLFRDVQDILNTAIGK
jgi:hypothetical protein